MVRVREEGERWQLEHILVTIQQQESAGFMDVCGAVAETLEGRVPGMQGQDGRWCGLWKDVEVLVNPNGPLVLRRERQRQRPDGEEARRRFLRAARSHRGRGAFGEAHGSYRQGGSVCGQGCGCACRDVGRRGMPRPADLRAQLPEPLDICYEMRGRGERQDREFFNHRADGQRDTPRRRSRGGSRKAATSLTWPCPGTGAQKINKTLLDSGILCVIMRADPDRSPTWTRNGRFAS